MLHIHAMAYPAYANARHLSHDFLRRSMVQMTVKRRVAGVVMKVTAEIAVYDRFTLDTR
jgi:hypothetical protein